MEQKEAGHEITHDKNLYSGGPSGRVGTPSGNRGKTQSGPPQSSSPEGGDGNDQVGPTTNNANQDQGGSGDNGTGDQSDPDGIGLCSV